MAYPLLGIQSTTEETSLLVRIPIIYRRLGYLAVSDRLTQTTSRTLDILFVLSILIRDCRGPRFALPVRRWYRRREHRRLWLGDSILFEHI